MHRSLRSCWLPLYLMLFGCLRDEAVPASTQVTLRVSSEQDLLEELTELRVSVALSEGEGWRKPVVKTFSSAVLRWPVDLPIVPRTRDDETEQIEIVVDALHDGQRLTQGRTITVFVHGEQVTRELRLFACPDHEPGFVCAGEGCAGSSCEVCRSDGSCTPVGGPDSDPDGDVTPDMDSGEDSRAPEDDANGSTTQEPDAALAPTDGGAPDSDADAKSPAEFGLAAAGQPCSTQEESSLSCEGHAARSVLKCQQGTWHAFRTCAANERCESRVGTELGSCVQIPNACVGKSAGLICDGTVRLECGIDQVTVVSRPCPEHTHCEEAGGVHCACDAGYSDDGSGNCVNANDCPAGACSGGSCIDGLSDYSCDCNSGFAGTGTKACSPVLYCPKDACTPGGTCTDTMNWSCQCNTGFSGTSTKACTNIDDCPKDRCKAPNGVCRDAVGSYACTCNPGFSGADCVNDICAPNPCRNGGTCSRTGTLCSCPQGYSGANCQTDACAPNPCLNGGVCSRTGTRCSCAPGYSGATCEQDACASLTCNHGGACVHSASGVSCNCNGTGYSGPSCDSDLNECTAGDVAACGAGATGCTNTVGSYSCGCAGAYVASADRRSCRTRAFSQARLIETADEDADRPVVAMDPAGNAMVLWTQHNAFGFSLNSGRYATVGAWNAPVYIANYDTAPSSLSIAMDAAGNALGLLVVDQISVRATRYAAGGRWENPSAIDNASTKSVTVAGLAMNSAGNALVMWAQNNVRNFTDEWSNRYSPTTGWAGPQMASAGNYIPSHAFALDSAGNGFAAWMDQRTATEFRGNTFSAGNAWGSYTTIATTGFSCLAMVADAAGSAVVAWCPNTGGRTDLVVTRAAVSGSWGSAVPVESDNSGSIWGRPGIAADASGNITLVWAQSDGVRFNLWANRYTGGAWGTAKLIESDNAGDASWPALALDGSGNAIAVWLQSDGTRDNVWANRFEVGKDWGAPVLLETNNVGPAFAPSVAADQRGNATVVWAQSDGSLKNIYAARFE